MKNETATTDIPIPEIRSGRPRKHKFDTLEVGESKVMNAPAMTIYGCIRYFVRPGGGNENRRFTVKAVSKTKTRIWRTK